MRKTNFLRKGVISASAIIAIAAIPTAFVAYGDSVAANPTDNPRDPYCLTVTENTDGSFAGAGYVGEAIYVDADGNEHSRGTFGFDISIETLSNDEYDSEGNLINTTYEDKITYLTLRSLRVGENSTEIYLPDMISVDYNGKTLTSEVTNVDFCYYTPEQGNTESNSFVDSPNLKDVYVNPSATNVTWSGEDFLKMRNFHFRSEEVPNFNFYSGSNGTINIYVPEALFDYYTDFINGANYTATVWSEDPLSPTYVNVDVPGTLADAISSNIDNLNSVRWLVLTGTPNEQDLRIFRRLPRLEILDLSAVTGLSKIEDCCRELKYLREVTLHEGLKEIGSKTFSNCSALSYVKIPSTLERIGEWAFSNCSSLVEVQLPPSVKILEDGAFEESAITTINLDDIEEIWGNAFRRTNLQQINLTNTTIIRGEAFEFCYSLKEVNFGQRLESIGNYCFYGCDLRKIVLPNSLKWIDYYSFRDNNNLSEVELGSGVKSIGSGVFSYCPIKNVTTRTLFPTEYSGFGDNDATLYVPAITLNEYLLADGWTMFKNVKPLEEELTDVIIDRTFMLTSDKGIANGATLRLQQDDYMMSDYGHLTVRRNINAPLNLGKYFQGGRKELNEYWTNDGYKYGNRYYGSTLIPCSEMTADDVELKISLQTGRWHFISLPFDVNVSDIKVTDEALWVVRKYSGDDRAALKETTWQNMTEGTVLKAGEGYIFHCAHDNTSEVEFTFKPASKESGNKLFAKEAVTYELTEYPSEFAHNASWNLVGNTYPAYLDIRALGFNAPVTLYDGSTYIAYSPEDDALVLEPFQAFFVQRQDTEGGDAITLNPEGRAHTEEDAAALEIERKKAPAAYNKPTRSLFNIHLTGETGSDRARVVINDEALMGYEKNRDASKFLSSEKEIPQIFVINDNLRMAIDERPLAEGEIALGAYFGKSGDYTISLDTRDAEEYSVLLVDHKTGVTTELTSGDYTFQADAATDKSRFTIVLKSEGSAAEAIAAEEVKVSMDGNVLTITAPEEIEIAVIAADGKIAASARTAHFNATLEKGIYAVKAGNETTKVIVK